MVYDSEDEAEAKLAGAGPRIHHFGLEVADQNTFAGAIEKHGGKIWSKPGEGALKFRSPDGSLAEIVSKGRYEKMKSKQSA